MALDDSIDIIWHSNWVDVQDSLLELWDIPVTDVENSDAVYYELDLPVVGWSIGLSSKFQKSVKGVDATLQGRILRAMMALASEPLEPHGDTVKPLEGDLKGLWRYRIADYRLIYAPDRSKKTILFVEFTSRGDAYD